MLRVGINMGFKMVPHFPPSARYLRSYIKSTDLLTDFSLFFSSIFSWFWCTANPQTSSHHVCKEDCCLNRPNQPIIDGDMRWDSGWFWGGFGVVGHLTRDVPRWNLGKKHPDHGGCCRPTAAMVPYPRHWGTQQSSNMPHKKSVIKTKKNIFTTIDYTS